MSNGGNPNVVMSKGFFSNAAAIAAESVTSPFTASSVVMTITDSKTHAEKTKTTAVNPPFKLVFWVVVVITIGSIAADGVLAAIWTVPTPNQQNVFDALGFAWRAGIGAIFGLLGGKAS